jgi:maleate isomerase
MYGYRARIGLIVVGSNTTCEPEIATLCPEGVAAYATRIFFDPSVHGLLALKKDAGRASRELSCEGICQIIAFCCTSGSMIGGANYDKEIADFIEKESNTPAIATATAVMAAFDALQVKKIAIATPYPGEVNQFIKEFIERSGYKVTRLEGVYEHLSTAELKNKMIGSLQPEAAYEMALKVDSKENDAILICGTNLRSIEIIQKLEEETSKPVITSNQATLWYALRKLGLKDRVKGYGRLMEYY